VLEDLFRAPKAPPGPATVLFVCTGNICRSPLAEELLRVRVAERLPAVPLVMASAGLHAVVGAPIEPEPHAVAVRHGGHPQHAGVQITEEAARSASVILTMTRAQRTEVTQEFPFALKRTFTLVEFTRILEELPGIAGAAGQESEGSFFDLVVQASRYRGMVASGGDEDDIEDPYRRSLETHERVGEKIAGLTARLA
jgi:protein-tyrosine phosphatase